MSVQSASVGDKWRGRAPVIQAICLLVVLTVGISVTFGRTGSDNHHATPVAKPSNPAPGFTPPPRTHCATQGNVITCHPKPKAKHLRTVCQRDPTAAKCVTSGDLCPVRLAGVVAQDRHATEFICQNHVWTRVRKTVTSGQS